MRKGVLLGMALAATGAWAAAAEGGKFDPGARARDIAAFIDEQTILVCHVDLGRVDVSAAFRKLGEVVEGIESDREVAGVRQVAGAFVREMLQAGARDVYLVVSLADVPPEPVLLVVPLRANADERAIRGLLYSGRAAGPTSRPRDARRPARARTQVHVVGKAVVRCTWPIWQRVKAMKPHKRPELPQAFAAAGDTAAQVLLLPTANDRRVIEEMLPELPKEIGGGPSTALTRGILWAAAGADGPPKASLRLVIQSRDARAAQTLSQRIARIHRSVAAMAPVRKRVRDIDKVLALLTPRVQGDRLTLHLPEAAIVSLVKSFLPAAGVQPREEGGRKGALGADEGGDQSKRVTASEAGWRGPGAPGGGPGR